MDLNEKERPSANDGASNNESEFMAMIYEAIQQLPPNRRGTMMKLYHQTASSELAELKMEQNGNSEEKKILAFKSLLSILASPSNNPPKSRNWWQIIKTMFSGKK